jgi:hypothetical protein
MTDPLGKFWAWAGAGTMAAFGLFTLALVLKDQSGAVNLLNAAGTQVSNTVGAFSKLG